MRLRFFAAKELDSHHGRDAEGTDESFLPCEKNLREVLADGEDGRDETVAAKKTEEFSSTRDEQKASQESTRLPALRF